MLGDIMSGFAILILLLLLFVPLGVTGVVLFIVGLVKGRTALWATGLAMGVAALLMGVAAAVVGGVFAFRSARMLTPPKIARLASAASRQSFQACTGLALPPGVTVGHRATVTYGLPADETFVLRKMTVPKDFAAFLEANFTQATWQDVSAALTCKEVASHHIWRDADVEGKAYCTRVWPADPNADRPWTTSIAHDKAAGTAYCVSIRRPSQAVAAPPQ